jgi:ATP adenylyltransferase
MNKSRLWAPWRLNYIKSKKTKACIFCRAKKSPRKNYVFIRGRSSMALLNIFPYNNGHIMVAPLRHVADPVELSEAEMLDLLRTMNKARRLLDKILKPQGYNIGINIGRASGAGITGHLHLHLVPRWLGDGNFMPVLGNTKVISQSLDELYKQLLKL